MRVPAAWLLSATLSGCVAFARCVSQDQFAAQSGVAECEWARDCKNLTTEEYEACLEVNMPPFPSDDAWHLMEAQCDVTFNECKAGRCLWVRLQAYQECDLSPWQDQIAAEFWDHVYFDGADECSYSID